MNLALANLTAQYDADMAGAEAKNAAARNEALIQQNRWQADYDMKAKQMQEEERQSIFKQAYNLYLKRLITAAQFKAMTGVSLKKS